MLVDSLTVLIAAQVADIAQIARAGSSGTASSPESPRNTWPVASRNSHGFGISRATEMPGVVDAVFAADQVVDDERPIGPRQHVVVQRVDLAERRAHLADLRQQAAGQRREA